MVSQCPGGVLHGYNLELDAVLVGCSLLPMNVSISQKAVALDSLWSSNVLQLLYIPF